MRGGDKMLKINKKIFAFCLIVSIILGFSIIPAQAAELKIGYVDIRKAFYEYEKTKTLEAELNDLTEDSQGKRDKMIQEITKLRDEGELLAGSAREKKQQAIDVKLTELQEFDKTTRQKLLNKKNDMFRKVIDDIQVVAEDIGKKGSYDFVMDSRNIMYAIEKYDLTEEVIKRLNK